MSRQIPQIVQDANAFINGKGYLGVVKKLKPPTIEFETIEAKGALSAEYSTGVMKPTSIEFTISKVDINTFASMGINTFANYIPFLFKASVYESGKGEAVPFSMAATGDIVSLEIAEMESGKEVEVNIKLNAHMLDININNIPVILKDTGNDICVISGVDYLAKLRANLGE